MLSETESLHVFLTEVAADADPDYQALLSGIATHFVNYGKLSGKQYSSVLIAANRQGRALPAELTDYVSDSRPPTPSGNAGITIESERAILSDLFHEISDALLRASVRLHPERAT